MHKKNLRRQGTLSYERGNCQKVHPQANYDIVVSGMYIHTPLTGQSMVDCTGILSLLWYHPCQNDQSVLHLQQSQA